MKHIKSAAAFVSILLTFISGFVILFAISNQVSMCGELRVCIYLFILSIVIMMLSVFTKQAVASSLAILRVILYLLVYSIDTILRSKDNHKRKHVRLSDMYYNTKRSYLRKV